jgi:Tfp pilus assembly protein PilX
MNNLSKKTDQGFALPLSLLLLVVMTIMGSILVNVTSKEHNANNNKDINQQTFYAAESGIAIAKKWMTDNMTALAAASPNNLNTRNIRFCKATFFPNLVNSNNIFATSRQSLSEVITGTTGAETIRLSNYSFEYFIAYSPDSNGNNTIAKKKTGTNNILYTIYSCGCNKSRDNCNSSDTIVPLEAVVTLVN